jgi:hypothetical protein
LTWALVVQAEQPSAEPSTEAAKEAKAGPASPNQGSVREVEPSLYYLKDKAGNLQPVPNFTFEDFQEMVRRKHRLDQSPETPRYTLQSMVISGTAVGDRAELTAKLTILTRDESWVRVPLKLPQAALREPAQYEGRGRQLLTFEEGGDGHVAWIRGAADQSHVLTLRVIVPLVVAGAQTRLRFSAPRDNYSELRLKVPGEGWLAQASEGATVSPAAKPSEGGSEFTVLGLGGDFELSWQPSGPQAVAGQPVLEAIGAVLVRIDDRQAIADARLTLRGYGEPFDRVRVRLPPGATLQGGDAAGYWVAPSEAKAPAAGGRQTVIVRWPKKTVGPVEVHLTTRQPAERAPAEGAELAGFEVLEASRQWGYVAVAAQGDWQIDWGPRRDVRQVDSLPEALRQEAGAAGFEYFRQPYSLCARAVPRLTRITVEPEYTILVEAAQVRLEALLKYAVRGAKVSALDIDLADWTVDEVGPDNLVAVDKLNLHPAAGFSIPLVQPSAGPMEIRVRAHRPAARKDGSLVLPLPRPQADSPRPAWLAVVPDDNVELEPKAESTRGLVRQPTVPGKLPERQQPALCYRVEGAQGVFAGQVRVHRQAVAVDVSSEVSFEEQKNQVEQHLKYTIRYVPLDRLLLDVPRVLTNSDAVEVLYEGQRLPLLELSGQDEASEPARRRVALPAPRIGQAELTIRFPLELEHIPPGGAALQRVPLVMPADGTLSANRLRVTTRAGLIAECREGPWAAGDKEISLSPRPQGLQLGAAERSNQAVLAVRQDEQDGTAATVIAQAWIQTWLTPASPQERAVFRFTTRQKELELVLPAGSDAADLDLWLDRQPIQAQTTAEGRLLVAMPEAGGPGPHTLEARYHYTEPRSAAGRLSVRFPHLGRDRWIRRMYWQLILPRDEHVVANPAGFTPEFQWGWYKLFWGRWPVLDQTALESWSGARHLGALRTAGNDNWYLFSTMGNVDRAELLTARRSWIVLAASAAALLVGLALVYVPAVRHPAGVLTLSVLLCAAVGLYPEQVLLLAQASSLGLVLAAAAGLLHARRFRRKLREPGREPSSSVVPRDSTLTQPYPVGIGDSLSTQSSPGATVVPISHVQ